MVYDPNWDYKRNRPANSRPGVPKHLPVNPSKNGGWDNPDAARAWIAAGHRPPRSVTKLPPGVRFPQEGGAGPPYKPVLPPKPNANRSVERAAARAARRARGG